ncbi:hypothetical protein GCM10007415_45170 [Parapedobacter pyrenivorans]|uniref:Uncharacterized protein n=1 Tax=Parapedobacter pyrenivorans TaxID=1305674 RepID=A0A917I3E3_9SPHI|nr:hypothetical protein GCM10007415_45170 [Parapedobacter pyrenivorans]
MGVQIVTAQITINLPQANISARTDFTATLASGTYSSIVTLLPTFSVRANTAAFSSTVGTSATVPLNAVRIRLRSIGSLSLVGLGNEVTLSTTYGTLYTALANLGGGAVTADYRVVTSSHTWNAGIFSTPIQFRTGALSPNQLTPTTPTLVLSVPAFIAPQATLPVVSIPINTLAMFRAATGVVANTAIAVSTTVPYQLQLRAGTAQFSFSTGTAYNQLPTTGVNLVNGTLPNIPSAGTIPLSSTDQSLSPAGGIAVPTANNQTLTAAFSISQTNLRTGFVQAGTYTVPITFTWSKLPSAYPTNTPITVPRTSTLQVVVSDMSELAANQQQVSLAFTAAADYRQGVAVEMANHLRVSKTTPYDIYVRATGSNFTSTSGEFPVGVLRIGPTAAQTGVGTITLSTTSQRLVTSADPVIDRPIGLRYSIPAAAVSQLLGQPPGVYTAEVIYSFTAL